LEIKQLKITLENNSNVVVIGSSEKFALGKPVSGLGIPPIRTSSQNYSGRDGGRVNAQYYSQRLITIPGFVGEMTCEDHELARQELQLALPIRSPIDVTIQTSAGNIYLTSGYITNFEMDVEDKTFARFKIDILCTQFYFLSDTTQQIEISRYLGGGFTLPVVLPITFAPGQGVVTANNGGTETAYPVITIEGTADTPRVTNVETGQFIEFDLEMSGSDTLVINMLERTAVLNGGSVLSLRNPSSSWWGLMVGANGLRFDTFNGADTATATIQWRDAILTI
jgi:phage-related protein